MTQDFDAFYRRTIAPLVEEAEEEVRRLRQSRQPLAIIVSLLWLVSASGGIYAISEGQSVAVLIFLTVFALFGGGILYGAIRFTGSESFAKSFAEQTASLLVEQSFGGEFYAPPDRYFVDYPSFVEVSGMKGLRGTKLRFGLAGSHKGHPFKAAHARSSTQGQYSGTDRMSGSEHHSVSFNGLILEVNLKRRTPTIVITERTKLKDLLLQFSGSENLQIATSGDDDFDKYFQISTDDISKVHDFITPQFTRAFATLERDVTGASSTVTAAFFNEKFVFVVTRPGKDILSSLMPSRRHEHGRPYSERTAMAYTELSLPYAILEHVPLD